ncbi:MAG: glycosyltransferase family 2 protein [Candidatus Vogelbacteria bacterium]|nr:glycosyltransferase family 2 protein [Candidatus Vogelbacteria bacterium]
MRETKPELSVVVLCYRSGNFAAVFSRQLKEILEKNHIDYELILVGNYKKGSDNQDRTPATVRVLAQQDEKIVAVVREKEGMMGWDMRSGFEVVTGDTVAVIDGDGQMPPEDIIKVYTKFKSGDFDIGKTYRDTRLDGFVRVVVSLIYNSFLRFLFPRVKVKDINSKPKIIKREVLRKLKLNSDDWFIDAEIIIKATYLGMSVVEVPTQFYPNNERSSFVGLATILEFIGNLISYRIRLFIEKKP